MSENAPIEIACEVAIVGAGPAGSTAACHLSGAGIDVCLIDRAEFPRDKVCGDLLGGDALAELARLSLDPRMTWPGRMATVSACHVVSCEGATRDYHLNLGEAQGDVTYVVRRLDFDNTLRSAATLAGAQWLSPYHCTKVEPLGPDGFRLLGTTRHRRPFELHAKAVIWAAGAGRGCATENDRNAGCRLVAGRAYYVGVEPPLTTSKFYYRDYLPTHYAWIFPLSQGVVNAGLIIGIETLRKHRMSLDACFGHAVAEIAEARGCLGGARRISPFRAAVLPTVWQPHKLIVEGILYVGDAAAMANPLNGEGIGPAMVSGRLAAEALLAAQRNGGFDRRELRAYDAAVQARYGTAYQNAARLFAAVQAVTA